jgi:putative acetyltransferase
VRSVELLVRDFVPEDQASMRALVLRGLKERWGAAFDERYNPDLDDIAAAYVSEGAHVVVVERDADLVGCGILTRGPDGFGRMVRISVAPTHRRQGLGRLVVRTLLERAVEDGLLGVKVLTDTPWTSATGLYRACGFSEVGHDDRDTFFEVVFSRPSCRRRRGEGLERGGGPYLS